MVAKPHGLQGVGVDPFSKQAVLLQRKRPTDSNLLAFRVFRVFRGFKSLFFVLLLSFLDPTPQPTPHFSLQPLVFAAPCRYT